MNAKTRDELEDMLSLEINRLSGEIEELEEMTKPVSPENAIGRVSRMDAINNKAINESALAQSREKLYKLELALSKIDSPEFGLCAMCMQPIAPARIMAMPESTTCIRCAGR